MAYTPEQLQKYKDYISQNKSQLDETKFQQLTKDRNALNEFQQTGAIAKTYFKPTQAPVPTTPKMETTQQPVAQTPVQTQTPIEPTQAPTQSTPTQQPTQPPVSQKPTPKAPKAEQPKTPTEITYSKDATPYNPSDVVSSAPAFQ
jgi:hypothetical protein